MSGFQQYAAQDEQVLFHNLRHLSRSLSEHQRTRVKAGFDPEDFDFLSDNMFVVKTHEHIGQFRFDYCGPAWTRMCRSGDISQIPFVELFRDVRAHDDLAGYAHAARMKMPHVSRNKPFVGGKTNFYTRLLLPQIRRGHVVSIIGTTVFHDTPIAPDLTASPPAYIQALGLSRECA